MPVSIMFVLLALYKVFLFKIINKEVNATIKSIETSIIDPRHYQSLLSRPFYTRHLLVKLSYSYVVNKEEIFSNSTLITKIDKYEDKYAELGAGDTISVSYFPIYNKLSEVKLGVPRKDRGMFFRWGLFISFCVVAVMLNIDGLLKN